VCVFIRTRIFLYMFLNTHLYIFAMQRVKGIHQLCRICCVAFVHDATNMNASCHSSQMRGMSHLYV